MTSVSDGFDADVRQLVAFHRVSQTLHRYASCIDRGDLANLRTVFVSNATVAFGDLPPVTGADTIVDWISRVTRDRAWQHHSLSIYHVDVAGDRAEALSYLTSHRASKSDPESIVVSLARYYDTLLFDDGDWRISSKRMEIVWSGAHEQK